MRSTTPIRINAAIDARARRGLALVASVSVAGLAGCSQKTQPDFRPFPEQEMRAVWVTRWDYQDANDIRRIMNDCSSLGLNTVLFQVRGQADAYYQSRFETRAESLAGGPPGFDPLQVALREARVRGLKLHAWVNVLPLWKGKNAPKDRRHAFYRHADWRLVDQRGRPQPLGDHYVTFNPCLPEVRAYLADVIGDIVERYPVDGVHLDYIRFVNDDVPDGVDYPYDAKTVALYRDATGRAPRMGDPAWNRWREGQIDNLVAEIRQEVETNRPGVVVTAAVFADRQAGRRRFFQFGERWLRAGWVDAVMPMIYRDNAVEFERLLRDWEANSAGRAVIAGIGTYKHPSASITRQQLDLARRRGDGFALFSYGAMTSSPPQGVSQREMHSVLAAATRR